MAPSAPTPQLPWGEDRHVRVPAEKAGGRIPQGLRLPALEPPNPASPCISLGCVTLGRDFASLGLRAPLKGVELSVEGSARGMQGLGCLGCGHQTQTGWVSVPQAPGPSSIARDNKIGSVVHSC